MVGVRNGVKIMNEQNSSRNSAIELYRKYHEYMVDKDTKKLAELLDNDFILVHMTGVKQIKNEWLHEIETEEMRYFSSKEDHIEWQVADDQMILVGQNRVDARIHGYRNTWPLQLKMIIKNVDEKWLIMQAVASTY